MLIGCLILLTLSLNPTDKVNPKDGAEMVFIPQGSYQTKGGYTITISGFWMYKYEVTNLQFGEFCTQTNRNLPNDPDEAKWGLKDYVKNYPKYPVVNITWQEAYQYAKWAGAELPTEAEWEYVAVTGKGLSSPATQNIAGQELKELFPHWLLSKEDDGFKWSSPVGSFKPNSYGVYDMDGNVKEWCNDWFSEDKPMDKAKDPKGALRGNRKVIRGLSFASSPNIPFESIRYAEKPLFISSEIGFRLVKRRGV